MKIPLNFTQVIAIGLCALFFIGAFLTYDPNDSAMTAVLGMMGLISGFVFFWEFGMEKAATTPDFDVTGPGDSFH